MNKLLIIALLRLLYRVLSCILRHYGVKICVIWRFMGCNNVCVIASVGTYLCIDFDDFLLLLPYGVSRSSCALQ